MRKRVSCLLLLSVHTGLLLTTLPRCCCAAAVANIEKKLEGTPDEPVPESIARQLQPYVSKLQDEGYDDRLALFRFPPVIGIRSYFMEVSWQGTASVGACREVWEEVWEVGYRAQT